MVLLYFVPGKSGFKSWWSLISTTHCSFPCGLSGRHLGTFSVTKCLHLISKTYCVTCSCEFLVGPLWLVAALKWSLPFSINCQWFTFHLYAHTIFPTSTFSSLILNLERGTALLWNDLTLQAANFPSVSGVYPAGAPLKMQLEAPCLPIYIVSSSTFNSNILST